MTARRTGPLGMGIAALLGPSQAENAPKGQDVPIDQLEPGPFQPRSPIQPETLTELAQSIRTSGLLQPILVRRFPGKADRLQIIAGERRWRAAQLAGLHTVPVLIRALDDRDALAAALVENLQRRDLDPIEEAEGYTRMITEFALTQESLGAIVAKSRSHVANTLRLLTLPTPVRQLVQDGQLSAGHARALVGMPEPAELARRIIAGGLNVRQTERLCAARDAPAAKRDRPPEADQLGQDLSAQLGLKVEISESNGRGRLSIRFDSLDQLEALTSLLRGQSAGRGRSG